MTAGELIEKLKTVYPDTEVIIEGPAIYDADYLPYHRYEYTKEDVKIRDGEFVISVYDP